MLAEIVLPAGTDRVLLRDIPELFADAIHGPRNESTDSDEETIDDIAWAGTVIDYEKAVKHAVMHQELIPLNAMTLQPMPGAIGQAMLNGIVTVAELIKFASRFEVGIRTPQPSATRQQLDAQAKAKADAGRYTLEEAAALLARNTGEREGEILNKLKAAAGQGILNTYEPDKLAKYQSENVREWYEEAFWDDLNKWLEEHEPRIEWRFPDPRKVATQNVVTRAQKNVDNDIGNPENWVMAVQAEAARRWRMFRAMNCSPTRNSLKNELAKWCRENNIVTGTGITPSAETIAKHAISKRHWKPPDD